MNTRVLATACLAIMSAVLVSGQTAGQKPQAPAAPASQVSQSPAAATQRAVLDRYCVTCHNATINTANLKLDRLDLARLGDDAATAEKVVRKLRAGMMPPSGMPRPDPATLDGLVGWLERRARPHRGNPSASARPAPSESRRVCQRHPRPAGARGGCDQVPAVRRFDQRVRQHRGGALDVAGARRGVSVGGRQNQPSRHRQREHSDADGVRRAD